MNKLYFLVISFFFFSTLSSSAHSNKRQLNDLLLDYSYQPSSDSSFLKRHDKLFFFSYGFEGPYVGRTREVYAGVLLYKRRIFLGLGAGFNSISASSLTKREADFFPVFISSKFILYPYDNFYKGRVIERRNRRPRRLRSTYFLLDIGAAIPFKRGTILKEGGWMINGGLGTKFNYDDFVGLFIEVSFRSRSLGYINSVTKELVRENIGQINLKFGLTMTFIRGGYNG
jgi:hypothetical protein